MKIVATSDTHGAKPALPFGDVLIHAGDFSEYGTKDEAMAAADWLAAQPHYFKIVVPGNHDKAMTDSAIIAEFFARGINVLVDNVAVVFDANRTFHANIYGFPWTPKVGPWAFDGYEPMLYEKASQIGKTDIKVDILVSHGPILNRLDALPGGFRAGCKALGDAVRRVRPRLHICGHIHEGYGHSFDYDLGTLHVNVAHMDARYEPRNRPYLISIDESGLDVIKP